MPRCGAARRNLKTIQMLRKPRSKSRRTVTSNHATESQRTRLQAERILNFWLAPDQGVKDDVHLWKRWFVIDPEFDRCCKALFLKSYTDAAFGRLDGWRKAPRSCLALVLLLDQFPRNMFRGSARAFATDAKAREVSRHAIASGFDRDLSPIMRYFLYLPFEHSEDLHDQMESLRLALALANEYGESAEGTEILGSAELHLETIRRFAGFPAGTLRWDGNQREQRSNSLNIRFPQCPVRVDTTVVPELIENLVAAEDEKKTKKGELGANQQHEDIPLSLCHCWKISYFPNFLMGCPHALQMHNSVP